MNMEFHNPHKTGCIQMQFLYYSVYKMNTQYLPMQATQTIQDSKIYNRSKFAIMVCLIYMIQLILQVSMWIASAFDGGFAESFYEKKALVNKNGDLYVEESFTVFFYILIVINIAIPIAVSLIRLLRENNAIILIVILYTIAYALFVAGLAAPFHGNIISDTGMSKYFVVVILGFMYCMFNIVIACTLLAFIIYLVIHKDNFKKQYLQIIGVVIPTIICIVAAIGSNNYLTYLFPLAITVIMSQYFIFVLVSILNGRFNLEDNQYMLGSILSYIGMWAPCLSEFK